MLKKQRKIIIILAAIFCIAAVVYFAVVKPIVDKVEPETETDPIETSAGEVVGINDRILLFEHTEKKNIKSIEVHNDYGTYTFYRDENDSFQILGHEGTTYDQELFSSLIVSCGYTLSMTKIDEPLSLESYGLEPMTLEDGTKYEPAYYILTNLAGVSYKVYVGYEIVTGAGYYVRESTRDDVYIVSSDIAKTVLAPIEDMVTPILSYPTSMTTYFYTRDFALMKGEELFVAVDYLTEEERTELAATTINRMIYPAGYIPSSTNYDTVIQTFIDFEGTKTLKLGIDDESMVKYGLENPAYTVYFKTPIDSSNPETGDLIENWLFISARQPDGSYYVASPLFDIIASVDGSTLDFLTWDLIKWVDASVFAMNIDNVESISVSSKDFSETFLLDGLGQSLVVTEKSTGHIPETANFRKFYMTLLTISMENYAELTEEQMKDYRDTESKCLLTLTIMTRSGVKKEFKFYPYTERKAYYTVDGVGEFYCLRTMADKIINDAVRVTKDETVDPNAKY